MNGKLKQQQQPDMSLYVLMLSLELNMNKMHGQIQLSLEPSNN